MSQIPEIAPEKAYEELKNQKVILVDIRDPLSFQKSHIPRAIHLSEDNLKEFIEQTPKHQAIIVCCYHGHSSLGATQFLMERGFEKVSSLSGGFEGWRVRYPDEI